MRFHLLKPSQAGLHPAFGTNRSKPRKLRTRIYMHVLKIPGTQLRTEADID